jgi:hypothetical protein
VRRDVGGDKKNAAQLELIAGGAGERQVSQMDGIKGPAKQANIHVFSPVDPDLGSKKVA